MRPSTAGATAFALSTGLDRRAIDPLLASVSTMLIVLTLMLMMVLDRFYGLDRVLSGKT